MLETNPFSLGVRINIVFDAVSFSSSFSRASSSVSSAAMSSVKAWIVDVATEIVSSYLDQSSELAIKMNEENENTDASSMPDRLCV